jgi:uncharacterized protein YycO
LGRSADSLARPAVLLFRGRGIISMLIRWQSRSPYSHAALLMPDGRIVESWQGSGVRIKSVKDWTDIEIYDVVAMDDFAWSLALDFAADLVGSGYDYKAVMRFVSRRPASDNERWFCSELVFAALQSAGISLLSRISAAAVSPGMLALSPLLVRREVQP